MVFDPAVAPKDHARFMQWYDAQTQWSEPHSYDDPELTTPALKARFIEIIQTFPPLNGPLSIDLESAEDEGALTDYSVGNSVIYAAFAWSKVDAAYEACFRFAGKHGVGFFNVSSGGEEIWWPAGTGQLRLSSSKPA